MTKKQRRRNSIFYETIFELSEGYFFIDQVLPFFCFSDFGNLFLSCKTIARLISKQHHVHYFFIVHGSSNTQYNRWNGYDLFYDLDHDRWKRDFPSLLHFADSIKIDYTPIDGGALDKIIDYCRKSNKLLNIKYSNIYATVDLISTFNRSSFNNLNNFGLLKCDLEYFEAFFKLFKGKNIKKIEGRAGYSNSDFIVRTTSILQNINFEELHYNIGGMYYRLSDLLPTLSKLDPNFRKKIKISIGSSYAITSHEYSALKNYANFFQFITASIESPPLVSENIDCNFSLDGKAYCLTVKSLTKIEDLALPKFSNNKPNSLDLNNIELSLTPNNANSFHVLQTNRFLTTLNFSNCTIDFSYVEKLELNLLNSLTLSRCSFLKNSNEANLEFIEWIDATNLTILNAMHLQLKVIPNTKSKSLTNLKLSNNEIEIIDLTVLESQTNLTSLDLQNNKLNDIDNINRSVGKYKQLRLENNPVLTNVIINKKKIELITDFTNNVNRGSRVITRPFFSGNDMEVYKSFKSALDDNKNRLLSFSKEQLRRVIKNPKKLTTINKTNVIFWNNNYSNSQKSFSLEGNVTQVGKISTHYCQVAIHLKSNLQCEVGNRKWILFGFNGNDVEPLDYEIVMPKLWYIVREWSFMSSHIDFVRELRRRYPENNTN